MKREGSLLVSLEYLCKPVFSLLFTIYWCSIKKELFIITTFRHPLQKEFSKLFLDAQGIKYLIIYICICMQQRVMEYIKNNELPTYCQCCQKFNPKVISQILTVIKDDSYRYQILLIMLLTKPEPTIKTYRTQTKPGAKAI